MARPPTDPGRSVVAFPAASRSALCGALLAIGALAIYAALLPGGQPYARGVAMVTAVIGSLLLTFAELAGERRWWKTPLPHDLRTWATVLLVVATLMLFTSIPSLASLLSIAAPTWRGWFEAIAIATMAVGWRSVGSNREDSSANSRD